MPDLLEIDRPGEVYAKGFAPKPAWEQFGLQGPPLMDLLPPSFGEAPRLVYFTIPANVVSRATAFTTGDPFAGDAYAILSGVASVGTPTSVEMFSWRKPLDEIRPYDATAIYWTNEPFAEATPRVLPVDPTEALRDILSWTRLRPTAAAGLLGVSRRSIYNWLGGGRIRDEFGRRIVRFRELVMPLAETRDPVLVYQWLTEGDPAPSQLVQEERWDELAALTDEATKPLQPLKHTVDSRPADEPETYSLAVKRAALAAFSASTDTPAPRETWNPPELTGLEPDHSAEE